MQVRYNRKNIYISEKQSSNVKKYIRVLNLSEEDMNWNAQGSTHTNRYMTIGWPICEKISRSANPGLSLAAS